MTTNKQKLFLSFTGLLRNFRNVLISESDLKGGLFYFGCTRLHVFRVGSNSDVERIFNGQGQRVLKVIQDALLEAEAAGRAEWRKLGEPNTVSQLNELLSRNNFTPIEMWGYSYPQVAEAIIDGKLPLEPIY